MDFSFLGAIVRRREPPTQPTYYSESRNERPALAIVPQGAPDPIRQSNFWPVGKPPQMAQSHMPIAVHFNIAGRQSVMEDSFIIGKVPGVLVTSIGAGGGRQRPWTERSNISRAAPVTYGERMSVTPGGLAAQVRPVISHGLSYDWER